MTEQDIRKTYALMKEHFIGDYKFKVQPDGLVDVVGTIELMYALDDLIPVQFGEINGNLNISNCGLKSLKGCGHTITGSLNASSNLITSLEGAPQEVGFISLNNNQELTSLEGAPSMVRTTMLITRTSITNLKGLPTQPGAIGRIKITYKENLPLLRLLVAGEITVERPGYGFTHMSLEQPLQAILNDDRWVGKGKSHMLNCALAMKKAGYVGNASW